MSEGLPPGWASARLGDIVEPIEVTDPTRTPDAVFRYIDIGSIDNEALRIGEPKTFSGQKAPSRARRVVREGDVLFSTVRPYLRNIALAGAAHSGCLTSTGVSVLRAKPSVLPGYLFRLVSSHAFVEEVGRSMDGTLYPAVRDSDIFAAPIPLPPLAEQRRIVARIEELFARIRQARADLLRIGPLADRYLERTLAAAFRGDLTAGFRATAALPAADVVLRSLRSQRQKAALTPRRKSALLALPTAPNSLPELPQGWSWACVEELASDKPRSIQSGPFGSSLLHSEFTPEGRLVIGIDNVRDGAFSMGSQNRIPPKKFAELERFQARPLDVLITVMATVGRCCVVPADIEEAIITKHVYRISVEPRVIDPYFLMNALRGSEAVLEQMGANIRGQTRPGINGEILKALFVPLPPLEEQREIVRLIDAAEAASARTQAESARSLALLDHLERSILTRAFRGDLVPQDPADEPAAVALGSAESQSAPRSRQRGARAATHREMMADG